MTQVTHKAVLALGGAVLMTLAACTDARVVSRAAAPGEGLPGFLTQEAAPAPILRDYKVVDVVVNVPETLEVSEANSYRPKADIVWRGDPFGDRRVQVAVLMREALIDGTRDMNGSRPVILQVELARFHALTQKARYTVGGVHDIDFWLTVVDAQTGEVIEPPRLLDTALPALGGLAALAAEARGETQKVRIQAFLRQVIRDELAPGSEAPAATPATVAAAG